MFASRAHWLVGLGGLWLAAGLAWPSSGSARVGLAWGLLTLAALALLGKRAKGAQGATRLEGGGLLELASICVAAAILGAAGQVLVHVPRTLWSLLALVAMVGLVSRLDAQPRTRAKGPRTWLLTGFVCGLMGVSAWLANAHEAAAPSSYAQLRGGVVLGANPRQSIALEYAPGRTIQVVLDDFVEARPPGVDVASLPAEARPKGDAVPEFAKRLQARLRASADILEPRQLQGSAQAHDALAGMRVESVPASTLSREAAGGIEASRGLRILSGARGPSSQLRVVCPGRLAGRVPREPRGKCPRKYASEANAGLGLTDNWPGYTQRGGSARVGFAALARRLGVESWGGPGLWLALWISVCASLYLFSYTLARAGREPTTSGSDEDSPIVGAGVMGLGLLALGLGIAALGNLAGSVAAGSPAASRGGSLFAELMPGVPAWRWPLMLALAGASLAPRAELGSDSARVPLRPLVALALVSLALGAWLSQGGGLGEQLVGARDGVVAWIELGSDLLARRGPLSYELARGLLASAALLILSAALVSVRVVGKRTASMRQEAEAPPKLVHLVALCALAWLSVRKPGLFNALVLGAWLGLEVHQRRARPRP